MNVITMEILKQLKKDLNARTVAMIILKQLMWLKSTYEYLGNQDSTSIIKGRHKEICARVKHMKAPKE